MRMKRQLLMIMAMIVCGLSLQAQGFDQHDADEKYATELVKVGETAPDFKLKTPDGKALKLSKLQKGRWTVIDFWASWCPDCRKDIPSVKRMYEDFAQKGVQFVGVSFDTDNEVWKNAIAKYDLKFPQVSELKKMRESQVAQAYGVKWIPSMVLVNPEGKVVLSTVIADKMERTLIETFAPKERLVIGTVEKLTIDGSKGKLAAVIQKPLLAQGQQCPMVMLCHGFGGTKEGQLFDLIADSLAMHGIASIRFDFNGHGESEGDFVEMTVPNEIEDAKKVYEYVRDMRYVNKVAILGHSQGGVVASMTAGELPDDFAAVVLMAPAAVLRDDAIRGSTMGKTYDPYGDFEYIDIWGKHLGHDYVKTAFRLPIYETAAHYQGPAMIIHGTGDRVVPYTYGLRYHQMWKGSAYEELEQFDHGFMQNVYRAARLASDFLIKNL